MAIFTQVWKEHLGTWKRVCFCTTAVKGQSLWKKESRLCTRTEGSLGRISTLLALQMWGLKTLGVNELAQAYKADGCAVWYKTESIIDSLQRLITDDQQIHH